MGDRAVEGVAERAPRALLPPDTAGQESTCPREFEVEPVCGSDDSCAESGGLMRCANGGADSTPGPKDDEAWTMTSPKKCKPISRCKGTATSSAACRPARLRRLPARDSEIPRASPSAFTSPGDSLRSKVSFRIFVLVSGRS